MGSTVNIDTGGTFTDGYFTRGDVAERVKVDTTPHDLTECLARCVAEGASRLGYPSVQALLLDTDVFRFSSTIGTNSIIQRTGPRIGLLVSAGAASTLYGPGESPLYEFFLRKDLVAEVRDPFDEEEVRGHVRDLLVGGTRILVASFDGSAEDPGGEEAVKKVVQRNYPRHYLGAVPCLIAAEVTPRPGAEQRTATAVINAYLHPDMVRTLYKADEDLRSQGYPNPLLIVHASGGVARVAKTRAIETYNSGPSGGVYATARMAAEAGIDRAVALDVGGTSTDVSVVLDAVVPFDPQPQVAGSNVHTPTVRVDAIGGGGGSIARFQQGKYTVGPDSAGASPGPAAYGLGGTNATATDAELVLGHIDPDFFLGGKRRLDPARARTAIERIEADDEVEAKAWGVHRALVRVAAAKVAEMVAASDSPPSEFTLFAFGGGGGLYGAEIAEECGIPRVFSFRESSVFSAFGISGMNVSHVYELRPGVGVEERIEALQNRAVLDAIGEHLDPASLSFHLEAEHEGSIDIVDVGDWTSNRPADAVRLRATASIARAPIVARDLGSEDASGARKGERQVHRPEGAASATVYDRAGLQPGNALVGPALVEAVDTTIVVPAGWRLRIDRFGIAVIERGS